MQILQLSPTIPLDTPKGPALAIFITWLSEEHHLLWTCIQDETGEVWTYENPKVRGTKSVTFGRIVDNKYLRKDVKPDYKGTDINLQVIRDIELGRNAEHLEKEYPADKFNVDLGGC